MVRIFMLAIKNLRSKPPCSGLNSISTVLLQRWLEHWIIHEGWNVIKQRNQFKTTKTVKTSKDLYCALYPMIRWIKTTHDSKKTTILTLASVLCENGCLAHLEFYLIQYCGVMVSKQDWQTVAHEFEFHWLPYTPGFWATTKQNLVNKSVHVCVCVCNKKNNSCVAFIDADLKIKKWSHMC